jgi:prophage regulatory protein
VALFALKEDDTVTNSKPNATNDNLAPRKMLNLKQVLAIVPFSRSTIYREMEEGRFPKAREIAPRRIAWYEDELKAWQTSLDNRNSASQGFEAA